MNYVRYVSLKNTAYLTLRYRVKNMPEMVFGEPIIKLLEILLMYRAVG